MLVTGQLMIEHRLIERMIKLMDGKVQEIIRKEKVDPDFLIAAVDFIKSYTDECHHGKEEGILFKACLKKNMLDIHRKVMDELIAEHVYCRKTLGNLNRAMEDYTAGNKNAAKDICTYLKELIDFYPRHIAKEDHNFFPVSMGYFSEQEQSVMIAEFFEFDSGLIHEKYKQIIKEWEEKL